MREGAVVGIEGCSICLIRQERITSERRPLPEMRYEGCATSAGVAA